MDTARQGKVELGGNVMSPDWYSNRLAIPGSRLPVHIKK